MKFGFRIPSLTKRIATRTSVKRIVRHSLGLKAPRGFGWITNPKRALYNRIYKRTTFGIEDLTKVTGNKPQRSGCLIMLLVIGIIAIGLIKLSAALLK